MSLGDVGLAWSVPLFPCNFHAQGRMDGPRDVRVTTAAAADAVAGKVWRRERTKEGRG